MCITSLFLNNFGIILPRYHLNLTLELSAQHVRFYVIANTWSFCYIEELPYLKVPLHKVLKLTPYAYGCKLEVVNIDVAAVSTYREKPKVSYITIEEWSYSHLPCHRLPITYMSHISYNCLFLYHFIVCEK